VLYIFFVYCVVVWQYVIGFVCVLCEGLEASYKYFVCILWLCASISLLWCIYCMVV